jgi:hypothetical protein
MGKPIDYVLRFKHGVGPSVGVAGSAPLRWWEINSPAPSRWVGGLDHGVLHAPVFHEGACSTDDVSRSANERGRQLRRPHSLARRSPFSQRFVSVSCIGSGWPQSVQRITRWLPFASISFMGFWHCGQIAGEDWTWVMARPWIRRERNTLSHRLMPGAGR